MKRNWSWWGHVMNPTRLVPTLSKQAGKSPWSEGQPGQYSTFQAGQGYIGRYCLKIYKSIYFFSIDWKEFSFFGSPRKADLTACGECLRKWGQEGEWEKEKRGSGRHRDREGKQEFKPPNASHLGPLTLSFQARSQFASICSCLSMQLSFLASPSALNLSFNISSLSAPACLSPRLALHTLSCSIRKRQPTGLLICLGFQGQNISLPYTKSELV